MPSLLSIMQALFVSGLMTFVQTVIMVTAIILMVRVYSSIIDKGD